MNTLSKEALDAAENVQDYWGFPRRATIDLATIIDRHFEPLRAGHVLLPAVDLAPDFDRVLCRLERLPETRVRAYFEALPKEWLDLRSTNLENYLLWQRGNRAALETRLNDLLP